MNIIGEVWENQHTILRTKGHDMIVLLDSLTRVKKTQ